MRLRGTNNKEIEVVQMILKRLKVETTLGDPTNCYIVEDEETKEAICIDPGGEADKIIEMLDILNANLKYIYLTHCHADHIDISGNGAGTAQQTECATFKMR